jgi:hypothetical protein
MQSVLNAAFAVAVNADVEVAYTSERVRMWNIAGRVPNIALPNRPPLRKIQDKRSECVEKRNVLLF